MVGIIAGYDCTGANLEHNPGGQAAGYVTGSGGVPWTAAQFAEHPYAVRIDQSPALTAIDETADVLDVERGAATNNEAAEWFRAAINNFFKGARPGQRHPTIYTSLNNVTPLVNALIAGGVKLGVGLWVAHYGITESQADALLNGTGGPFPIVAVQYANTTYYDLDRFNQGWLDQRSSAPVRAAPPATPPPAGAASGPTIARLVVTATMSDGSTQTWAH